MKKERQALTSLLLLLAVSSVATGGCGGGTSGTGVNQDIFTLSGNVVDSANRPVAGATVVVLETGQQVTTDETGAFDIIDAPAMATLDVTSAAGDTTITVANTAEATASASVTIVVGDDSSSGTREQCNTTDMPCRPGFYCEFAQGSCGAELDTGLCSVIPEVCYEIYGPVCGCDGMTYENFCKGAGAGVSIRREAPCRISS
jgi:hypothetical protein